MGAIARRSRRGLDCAKVRAIASCIALIRNMMRIIIAEAISRSPVANRSTTASSALFQFSPSTTDGRPVQAQAARYATHHSETPLHTGAVDPSAAGMLLATQ